MPKISIYSAFLAFILVFVANPAKAQNDEPWHDKISLEFGITSVLQGTSGNDIDPNGDQTDYAFSADLALIGEIAYIG